MQELVGETFSGRYSFLNRIAGGGMGDVYRARDLLLDRTVAVKVLQPSLASDPDFVDRFRAEARAAARLTHPNVVGVYDWGSADDLTYYMVMEYVPGRDLRQVLAAQGALEPAQAVQVMAEVCDALDAAHATGLVHRDVKPENILIDPTGKVKVVDFGIAIAMDADGTMPGGSISGTLRYLSPEQAEGQRATPASDIWAAGAVLSEIVTARPPVAASPAELLRRRAVEPPVAPSEIDPELPEDLDAVVRQACALDPGQRFSSAGEMAQALLKLAAVLPEASPLRMLLDEETREIRLPEAETTSVVDLRERERVPRRRWPWKIALALGLLLFFIVGGFKLVALWSGPRYVGVPALQGSTATRAMRMADAAGLHAFIGGRIPDYTVPQGKVVAQFPARGRLPTGARVRLVLSSGLPTFEVPRVVGASLPTARSRFAAVGMGIGATRRRYSTRTPGTVIAQQPSNGSLAWGSHVDLVISKGPRPAAVPKVAGLQESKAKKKLETAGFPVTEAQRFSNSVAKGVVITSAPAPGTILPTGSAIELFVSAGPRYKRVTVPDVRNTNVAYARKQLEALGLLVQVVQSCGGGGSVVQETDPIPGTTVRQHDHVALFVC
ncbi:MAG: Stk1 family PASTA domain-containing Ser/Thr kinase [Actinomycetota bacterium]|nr:Stk1 family PASTA domain-containing Ser/Thr kinase [Actinomycetota bacterium]